MKQKSILFVLVLIIVSTIFPFNSRTQAETIKAVSYAEMVRTEKNDVPAVPKRLIIPTVKIDADIQQVGLRGDSMAVPDLLSDVGWYQYGYRPGEKGNAVIAGHRDDAFGQPAVFWKLGLLRLHDIVQITDGNGLTRTFRVVNIQQYEHDSVPIKTLFTKSLTSNIILITCSGSFDRHSQNYSNRLIVTATEEV